LGVWRTSTRCGYGTTVTGQRPVLTRRIAIDPAKRGEVSLFDVHNPAAPTRLDQYHLQYAKSEAEFDPHAFLYWPTTGLLVIPVTTRNTPGTTPRPGQPASGALILTVLAGKITLLGTITHPSTGDPAHTGLIRRSLIINQTLWTFSDTGLAANDTVTMDTLARLPS
jgi:hypothetical protein